MLTPQVPVAKEGYPFIGFAALTTGVAAALGWTTLALLALLATGFTLYFFRDPERFTPVEEGLLLAPADGRVIRVERVQDELFTGGPAQKVSIFMNVFDIHVNRAPCPGRVESIRYRPGRFYAADSAQGGLENEYCATIIRTPAGRPLAVVQIAGLIARRIVCWLEPGDTLTPGKRFGLIRFGSRVDLYLPPESTLAVKVGDKVRAGETVLGRIS